MLKPLSLTLAVTAAALVAGGCAQAASATTGSDGWVATHTQGLNLDGQSLGATPAAQQLEISAVLPLRNASSINGMIEAGDILTPAQVAASFGPSTTTVDAVEQYLRSNGFTGVSVSGNSLLVSGEATVTQAEHAFDTSISTFELHGRPCMRTPPSAMVPSALGGDVAAVLGLSDMPIALPRTRPPTHTSGFTPKAVANIYDDSSMKPRARPRRRSSPAAT